MLIDAARRWCREALEAWTEDDAGKVALLAPTAVELLGKAALWRVNPVLLVQLSSGQEKSLHLLATKPDLAASGMTTIGLHAVLARLGTTFGELPIGSDDQRRLISVRNGATHVGSTSATRDVLVGCLAIIVTLLERMDLDQSTFFGLYTEQAHALVSEQRSQIAERVAGRVARARVGMERLSKRLGEAELAKLVPELAARRLDLVADDYVSDGAGIDIQCPACTSTARLFGEVQVRGEADFDVVPVGGGDYESVVHGYWQPELHPQALYCTVCALQLHSPVELASAGISTQPIDVDEADLGEDFDIQAVIDAETFQDER